MMNKIRYFLLALAIPLLFSNCEKEDETPKEPVEFKLRLLNENLEESTVFNEGENIIFSFYIKNNSSEKLAFKPFQNQNMFQVFKLTGGLDVDYSNARTGISFPTTLIGIWFIPTKDNFEFRVPWINTDNPNYYHFGLSNQTDNAYIEEKYENYLPKGRYYTEFNQKFEFDNSIENKSFKVEFTVK